MEAFEHAGGQHRFGAHEIDRFESGKPGEQIEVSRPQAVGIGDAIGHGDDDPPERPCRGVRRQHGAERVLVQRVGGGGTRLVGAERGGQKDRLLQQLLRAAIDVAIRLELVAEVALEIVDRAAQPTDEIVEREHLGDQPGPDLEGRREPFVDQTARHRRASPRARRP